MTQTPHACQAATFQSTGSFSIPAIPGANAFKPNHQKTSRMHANSIFLYSKIESSQSEISQSGNHPSIQSQWPVRTCTISPPKHCNPPDSITACRDFGFQFDFQFWDTMVAIHTLMMTTMSLLLLQLLLLGNFAASTSPEEDSLAIHNKIRSAEDIPPLKWSSELATYALRYAERQRDHHQCAMVHSRGQYGENLFWGNGKAFTLSDAVHSWAKEADHYDYESNSCTPGKVCGHYTQLVWADTKKVGCASVRCHDGATFTICSYDPPGNFVGERPFERKVGQNRDPKREPKRDGDGDIVKRGEGGDENVKDVEAKLCQCMLSCVSKAKSKQWRDEVTAM